MADTSKAEALLGKLRDIGPPEALKADLLAYAIAATKALREAQDLELWDGHWSCWWWRERATPALAAWKKLWEEAHD